ncbi:MAG: hypothetical protein M3Q44_05845 [bacterium]|nr:hypothetical protein [bacterium]
MPIEALASPTAPTNRIESILPPLGFKPPHFIRRLHNQYCPDTIPNRVVLTAEQDEWLTRRSLDRDGVLRSDWTGYRINRKSIHHIQSVLWLQCRFDPLGQIGAPLYNTYDNLIVLSDEEHMVLHPESRRLNLLYVRNRPEFHKEVRALQWRVLRGEKNWVDTYDEHFNQIVVVKSLARIRQGDPWPILGPLRSSRRWKR